MKILWLITFCIKLWLVEKQFRISFDKIVIDSYVISNNYARIKVDSNDFLPLEKTLTFHNVAILIKPVFR